MNATKRYKPTKPVRSQQLIELMLKMVEWDPNNRISWEELMNHPLIVNCSDYTVNQLIPKTT